MKILTKHDINKMSKDDVITASSYWNEAVIDICHEKKISDLDEIQYGLVCTLMHQWLCNENNFIGAFVFGGDSAINGIERLAEKTNFNPSEEQEVQQFIKHAYKIYENRNSITDYSQFKSFKKEQETTAHYLQLKDVYDNTI